MTIFCAPPRSSGRCSRQAEASRPQRRQSLLFGLITFFLSVHFSFGYLSLTYPMIKMSDYIELNIRTPFRYRIFPYFIFKGILWACSALHFHFPALNPPLDTQYNWLMMLVSVASMIVAVLFTAAALEKVTGSAASRWLALLIPLCAYFNYILVLNRNQFYPYDAPVLPAFAGLIYFAICRKYVLFALWFIPAMLTKETAIFAILFLFLLHVRRDDWKKLFLYCAAMSALGLAIKYLLYKILFYPCADCVALGESHFLYNLKQLANPLFWFSVASVHAYLWIFVVVLWNKTDRRLRRAYLCMLAPWILLLFKTTIMRELRLFSEQSIPLVILLGSALANWFAKPAFLRRDDHLA